MILDKKNIIELAEFSPVLTNKLTAEDFDKAIVIPSDISSQDMEVTNTRAPEWYIEAVDKIIDTIIIDGIDVIDDYEQQKFYELLKYNTITSQEFPTKIKIFVLYKDLKKVSKTITSLCQIFK